MTTYREFLEQKVAADTQHGHQVEATAVNP